MIEIFTGGKSPLFKLNITANEINPMIINRIPIIKLIPCQRCHMLDSTPVTIIFLSSHPFI